MPTNSTDLSSLLLTERPTLMRLVGRIAGQESAEDITQKLWFKIQKVRDDPPISNKRAYLFRLAANEARDYRKHETRQRALHTEAHFILWEEEGTPSPEHGLLAADALRRVADAAELLPEPTKRIFHLNRFADVPQRAIAAQLGLSSTTVENHIKRALRLLAAARDGGGSHE
ncbi:hypothetical protein SKP52_21715 [Sphingopyxis fribergensis]|uniref:ECF subfamily RNA polymerase sigma-24 factor n=2 Tax=Sphingopyxis fribergensis TaxID=1515612 RepID=A0A0A7PT39_9SPHN|nr:hypothetical protein SKP52_21715 [Sphingopyxis fribergensis]